MEAGPRPPPPPAPPPSIAGEDAGDRMFQPFGFEKFEKFEK